jgi:hypothetical protein
LLFHVSVSSALSAARCLNCPKHLLFRSKIRFHGPSAIVPCVQHVVRAGTAVGSGGGRAGDRARSGGHEGWSEVESTKNCQNKITGSQKLLILQLHIAHDNSIPVVCAGRAGFLESKLSKWQLGVIEIRFEYYEFARFESPLTTMWCACRV